MTVNMFIGLITVITPIAIRVTNVLKDEFASRNINYSSNLIALIISIIAGVCGTAIGYVFFDVEFTVSNIICMPLVGLIVWFGSMIGYDKTVQMIEQLSKLGGN